MYRLFFCLIVAWLSINNLNAQGCSDAGFCTMGAMKPNQRLNRANLRIRSIELTEYYGQSYVLGVHFLTHILDANIGLDGKTTFQTKMVYNHVFGNLANTQGLGDISLSITRLLWQRDRFQFNGSLGGKLPTYAADKSWNGLPLPMYYQNSLGTYDIVGGFSLLSKHFLVATGIQHSFNSVRNSFTWGAWKDSPKSGMANHYPISNQLDRGTDVMFRIEANMGYKRWNGSIGILSIERLNNDIITSPQSGRRIEAEGSKGNASTVLTGLLYNLNAKSSLKGAWGYRITKRSINPDGLSRENVWTFTYQYRF